MKTYRVGVVGMGFGREVHVPGYLAHPRFELVAVAGARPTTAAAVARATGAEAHADWRELVARDDLDVVSVATAPNLHAPVALAALERARHIVLEKPTAMDAREAGDILEAARARGLHGAIVHEFRFWPARHELRRRIAAGDIGRPLAAHVVVPRPTLDRGRAQALDWWSRAEAGGGVLGAAASHQVDSLTWWFGEEVVRVFAHLRATVPLRPAEGGGVERVSADDSYTLHLEFASGATATVCMDVSGAAFGDRWEVVGESGALQMEADARLSRVGPDGGAAEAIPLETLAPPALPAGLEAGRLTAPFLRLLDRFAARLDGDAEAARDLPDLAQGLRVQRVLDAARLSSATGAFVRVLP